LDHARTEIFEEYVSSRDQRSEVAPTIIGLEVDSHGLLIAVGSKEVRGELIIGWPDERGTPATTFVPALGVLYFDDARTHVCEHHCGVRPCERSRKVDDNLPGQWAVRRIRGVGYSHVLRPRLVARLFEVP